MAHHPKFSPFRVVGYTLNSHVLGLALMSSGFADLGLEFVFWTAQFCDNFFIEKAMIGSVFELLKGLPHEADQFSMEKR